MCVCVQVRSTFVLVEDSDGGSSIRCAPEPHRPVSGARQQSVMSRAVDQTPDRICVSRQRPPQHRRLYSRHRHTPSPHTHSQRLTGVCRERGRTVRVVRVDVGARRVPALDARVQTAAETLLTAGAHHHTQNRTPETRPHTNHIRQLLVYPAYQI